MSGLSPTGFVKETLPEILAKLNERTQEAFGAANTDPTSVFGQYNSIISEAVARLWELAEEEYHSQYALSATGVSLDAVAELNNITRLPATSTTVQAIVEATLGTVVPQGTQFRQSGTEEIFESIAEITVTQTGLLRCVISINDISNQPHTISIETTNVTDNYSSILTASASDILDNLRTQINSIGKQNAELVDNTTLVITATDNETPFNILVGASVTIDELWYPVNLEALNTGVLPVSINSISNIETPVAGLDAVDNLSTGVLGRNVETDDEFRVRRKLTLKVVGGASVPAIEARLVEEIPNVSSAIVKTNRTNVVDSEGRPPHSYEAIVVYPLGDTVTEQLIADKLWEVGPAGIETVGDITYSITDSTGELQTIKFSKPTDVLITVELEFEADSENTLPSDFTTAIKNAIVAFSNGSFPYVAAEQLVGKDVIVQKYFEPIYSIQGVGVITRLEMKTPTSIFSSTLLPLASTEIAILDNANISVTLNP